jgi:hypothetical protein
MSQGSLFTSGAITALVLTFLADGAVAQEGHKLRDQIIGTWSFVVAEVTAPGGNKSFPFGQTPKGILIFTPDGHFSDIKVASEAPRLASNNRLGGTPDEYTAIARQSVASTGTYTIDEAKKTITFKTAVSTFTNAAGGSEERTIDKLTTDEFVNTNPNVAGGRGSSSNQYRRIK